MNRPEKRNALSIELMKELVHAMRALPPTTRILILEGSGAYFSAGLDLTEAVDPKLDEQTSEWIARTLQTLAELPFVTVAFVTGGAYAGGLGLVAACDLALATEKAVFALPELTRGLVPALVHVLLEKLLPPRVLREMILTGEPIKAFRAATIHLINHLVASEKAEEALKLLTEQIMLSAPGAFRLYKKHLLHSSPLTEAFATALKVHREAKMGAESKEGISAFLQRRKPQWGTNL